MFLFRIIKVIVFIFRFQKTQNKFTKFSIDKFLLPFEQQYQSKINVDTLRRIREYYSKAVPLTCAAYASIYGRNLTPQERENASLAGIITPLIDDFTDKYRLTIQQVEHLVAFSGGHPAHVEEAIVKSILNHLIKNVTSPEGTLKEFNRTLAAQHESEKQLSSDLPENEILRITFEKGGASLLLFHYLIEEIPGRQMIDVINQMGGTLQLGNDIFDVYADLHEGVKTIPTSCQDLTRLENLYLAECIKFYQMATCLNHKKKDLELFITFFTMLLARGMVALTQLSRLQRKLGGGPLSKHRVERKLLISDMEKPANLLRAIFYTWRIMKLPG